jgi:hypothetical protein
MAKKPPKKGGFFGKKAGLASVEYGVVAAVVIVLGVAIFFMVDPIGRRVTKQNDQRWEDVEAIHSAIVDAMADEAVARLDNGLPETLAGVDTKAHTLQLISIGQGTAECGQPCGDATLPFADCTVDLAELEGRYIHQLPIDPDWTTPDTGYFVNIVNETVTVGACTAEEVDGSVPAIRVTTTGGAG